MALSLTATCLTLVVSYRFYNQPRLAAGKIAETTLRAPADATVEDTKATQAKQEKILAGINPILQRDSELTAQINLDLSLYLESRRRAGKYPWIEPKILSLQAQQYLRSSSPQDWEQIRLALKTKIISPSLGTQTRQVIQELSRNPWLVKQVEESRSRYKQALELGQELTNHAPEAKTVIINLLQIEDDSWPATAQATQQALNLILTQGLPPGLPRQNLEETISLDIEKLVPKENQAVIQQLLLQVLKDKHNLEIDREATRNRARTAIQSMTPETVAIQKGEIIVRAGETISSPDFVLLDHFGLSRRGVNWWGVGLSGLLVCGSVGLFWTLAKYGNRYLRCRDYILLGLLGASTPLLAIAQFPYTNLAAIGILTSSFYGPSLAVTQVLLLSGLSSFAAGYISWDLLAGTAGGLITAFLAARLRSRDELALLGSTAGFVQGGVYLIVYLIISSTAGTIWYAVLPHALIYGLSGLAWSIIALGLSPYFERFFDLVTPIRLVELSNLNRPLLQRLALEAPGTFQHTLFVSCLAEAATRTLHGNVELVRAGTLYHDIGKMHNPLAFIENQMGQPNKHEQINDPWLSAEIIKKHVSEGLVMARQYGLPRAIRDFIPEHQGTLPISYFYNQAQERLARGANRPLSPQDFHYDGPIPQSRETAIVMLADSCEAALRSLKGATPLQAMDMIKKIFQARWREQQLQESGLKYEELKIIAEVFVQVWQQFHHERIPYPQCVLEPALDCPGATR